MSSSSSSSRTDFLYALSAKCLQFTSFHNPNHNNLRIEFVFSSRFVCSGWNVTPDLGWHMIARHEYRLPKISIVVDLKDFYKFDEAERVIENRLNELPFWNDSEGSWRRRTLVNYALLNTHLKASRSMPADHNAIRIEFGVSFYCGNFYYEESALRTANASGGSFMVPASESAVRALRRKKISATEVDGEDPESCCGICLEEFGEEALEMPCSHYFHGECLRKWLSISHYCPFCRFDMTVDESWGSLKCQRVEQPQPQSQN